MFTDVSNDCIAFTFKVNKSSATITYTDRYCSSRIYHGSVIIKNLGDHKFSDDDKVVTAVS
jgi:hypothetical protein